MTAKTSPLGRAVDAGGGKLQTPPFAQPQHDIRPAVWVTSVGRPPRVLSQCACSSGTHAALFGLVLFREDLDRLADFCNVLDGEAAPHSRGEALKTRIIQLGASDLSARRRVDLNGARESRD